MNKKVKYNISDELKKFWSPAVNKILFITAAVLTLIIILINPVINGIIKPKILESVNRNKAVRLKTGDIAYNVFTQKLFIENILVAGKNTDSGDSARFMIPSCQVSDLKWLKLLLGNGLSFDDIIFSRPKIFINSTSNNLKKDPDTSREEKSTLSEKILNFLPSGLRPLTFKKLRFNLLTISQNINGKRYDDTLNTFTIIFSGLKVDSSVIDDQLPLVFAEGVRIFAEKFSYHFNDDYQVRADTLISSSSDSSINFKDLSFRPYVTDDEFFKHRKYSSDRYIIKVPSLNFSGIDFSELLRRNNYFVKKIFLDNLYFNVCSDYAVPPDPNSVPKMPNELMLSAKNKIDIENIKVKNAELHIKAKHRHVKKYSDVPFKNVYTEIKNISNIPGKQTSENPCVFNSSGQMFNAGILKLIVKIPLLEKEMNFNYHGSLSSMSALPINSQIKWANQVEIKSGKIDTAEYSVHVLKKVADVYVKALYSNLTIEQLKENSDEGGILNKTTSFLANKFKLRKSNPGNDGDIKTGTIIYPKEKSSTFLSFVWSAVKKALGEVVGF